ncbi:hypothetical protein G7054_g11525 [Neopestalotiopsis clavispora]|nr:hypothetical protein G7054_g11525 [Neopestalotiopsis clavispora]
MDPLGTLANVLTLFEFSVKLQELVSRWKDAPEHLRQLEKSVSDMRNVLRLVTDKSEATVAAAMVDQGFMDTIGNLAKTCSKLVRELYEILLSLDKTATSLERIRYRLTGLLKERDINDKRRQIQEYTAQLNLLVASLNSKQSARIEATLEGINRKLDDVLTLPSYTSLPEDNATIQEEPSQTDLFGFLLEEATVPTQDGGLRRPSLFAGLKDVELRNMEEKVQDLKSQRMFHKAAQIQQSIVEMVKSQVDVEDTDDICHLQEQHADLLLECSTPARIQEATTILSDALQRQKDRAPRHASRLMSKLAKLYQNRDRLGDAHNPRRSKSFFTNSIVYLSRAESFLPDDFLTVGAAMVHFYEANSEPGLAKEIEQRILDTMKQRGPDFLYDWDNYSRIQEESVLSWCQQQGFNAYQSQFRFNTIQASHNGNTSPLHLAVHQGKKEIVEKMVVELDDVDLLDDNGITPLLLAARKRESGIAQVLLKYGASTELRTPEGKSALHLCLEEDSKGGVKVTECLLNWNPELIYRLDEKGRTALHLAVMKGHQKIASLLLQRSANVEVQTRGGKKYADIQEENGKTPLLMAVESRTPKPIRAQTNLGRMSTASTSATIPSMDSSTSSGSRRSSQTSYSHATGSSSKPASRIAIIALLLDNGANPTIPDYTDNLPLHSACKQNDIETVKLLLQKWAQHGRDLVNQPGPMRATPIIAAVRGQHVAIVRELIRWGANPSLKDSTGKSAGDYARHPATRKHDLTRALQGA